MENVLEEFVLKVISKFFFDVGSNVTNFAGIAIKPLINMGFIDLQ